MFIDLAQRTIFFGFTLISKYEIETKESKIVHRAISSQARGDENVLISHDEMAN